MEFLKEFISVYGTTILYSVLTAIAGYVGIVVKNLYQKYINDKTKQDVAKTVVQAVEQMYKDLHGDEKLQKALEAASDMLMTKGITISEIELRMLIEAAVGEFNDAFNSTETVTEETVETTVTVEDVEVETEIEA